VPYLRLGETFPDDETWKGALPRTSVLENLEIVQTEAGRGSKQGAFVFDQRAKPTNVHDSNFYNIRPLPDERSSFVSPTGLILQSRGETEDSFLRNAQTLLDAQSRTFTYLDDLAYVKLSDDLQGRKPSHLRSTADQDIPAGSYDGFGFITFPGRQGLETWMLEYAWDSSEFLSFFCQLADEDMFAFLQAWLYFGFLSEVFGRHIRVEDFVTKAQNGQSILTTQKLLTTDQWKSWLPDVRALPLEARQERVRAITQALELASKFTRLEDAGTLRI
jgi:hypothetical protein